VRARASNGWFLSDWVSLSYDANGNLTGDGANTYTWDARNHLSAINSGTTASFVYDAFGRRIGKTVNGTTTEFLYDGLNPVQELDGGNPPSVTANLLTGLNIDEYFTRTVGSTTSTLLADALGSTIGLVGSGGTIATSYTYQPFGAVTTGGAGNTNPFQFTGRENDGTGLYFYRARYYSPTFQRFIAQDPIGFKGGDANLYAYVHDSPPVLTDPFGTCGGTPQNPRCNPFFLTYETALYIGRDTFKGFGYGGAIGLGTGLIIGVPEVGGLLGAGLGTIGGSAYGAYEAIQNIEADCQF
jgi:RHS repeat-associated protein